MFFDIFDSQVKTLNDSKYFAGIIMILINIGSRFIDIKFSKNQEKFIKYIFNKEVLIFAVSWRATGDIYMALILTVIFAVSVNIIFNDECAYCILPEKMTNYSSFDLNGDGEITDDEIEKAKELLKNVEKNKKRNEVVSQMSYLKNNLELYPYTAY
jgi:hypothetical protein